MTTTTTTIITVVPTVAHFSYLLCSFWLSLLPVLRHFATEAPTRRPKATKGTPWDPQNTPESHSEALLSTPRRPKRPHRTPQETPKRRPRHPRGAFWASFWPHFGSLDGSLDESLIFYGFVTLFGSLFELMLAPFSIQKLIIFIIKCSMFFIVFRLPFSSISHPFLKTMRIKLTPESKELTSWFRAFRLHEKLIFKNQGYQKTLKHLRKSVRKSIRKK